MTKVRGGETFHWTAMMAPVVLNQTHWDAIRTGGMSDSWFESVADACWQATRVRAIAQLRNQLQIMSRSRLPVVDRRVSVCKLVEEA